MLYTGKVSSCTKFIIRKEESWPQRRGNQRRGNRRRGNRRRGNQRRGNQPKKKAAPAAGIKRDSQISSTKSSTEVVPPTQEHQFADEKEALKKLQDGFEYWSGLLSSNSIHAAYALIAANWAVYGTSGSILNSVWARSSLVVVLFFLALNLVLMRVMAYLHSRQYVHAEKNRERWVAEYKTNKEWPYTRGIERLGHWMRYTKVGFPIFAGILLVLGVILDPPPPENTSLTTQKAPTTQSQDDQSN